MTLFGVTLNAGAIASLVGLIATLLLWVIVLRGEQGFQSRFRRWEADRKARRDAERARNGEDVTDPKRGPWG
ncbi:hypothetical protein BH10PSE2_BH10PSE2_24200 [soil metagenome]